MYLHMFFPQRELICELIECNVQVGGCITGLKDGEDDAVLTTIGVWHIAQLKRGFH